MEHNESQQNNPQPRPLRVLTRIAFTHWKTVATGMIGIIGAALSLLAMARGAQFLVDRSLSDMSGQHLNLALTAMIASAIALAASSYLRSTSVNALADKVAITLRKRIFKHLLALDAAFYASHASGDLVMRLSGEIGNIQTFLATALPNGIRNAILLAGALTLMAYTSPQLSLLTMLVVPVISVPVLLLAPRLRRLYKTNSAMTADLSAFLSERIGAMRSVQLFGAGEALTRDMGRHHERISHHYREVYQTRATLASLIIVLMFSLIAFILWSGGRMVIDGTLSAGEVAAFVMYAVISAGALATLTELGQSWGLARTALERLGDIEAVQPELKTPAQPKAAPAGVPRIVFENVSFAYDDNEVLDKISFTVEPRESIAIVGPSGAGKSTIFALLTRLYDPQAGRITLDGTDIREFDLDALRRLYGVIPQEPDLFSMSITDNIAFGIDADEGAIRAAAKLANASGFIDEQPQGYAALLGERGQGLSAGQKQRLAIARALLRDPKILLMDEATSALDAESEELVQKALEQAQAGRTAIVVAHRLATIRDAHRILVLEKGRIAASGTHDALIAQGGLYARLAELQFLS